MTLDQVVAAALLGWLPWPLAPLPGAALALVYWVFWGCYPAGGGNFNSQVEAGGGVGYEVGAADVARAVRWVWDHAARLGIDRGLPLLILLYITCNPHTALHIYIIYVIRQ